jgi:hypothetical protein
LIWTSSIGSWLPAFCCYRAGTATREHGDSAVNTGTEEGATEGTTAKVPPELAALVAAANLGDAAALRDLRQALDDHPEIWREAGDLAAHVEKTWLRLAAGGNALVEESLRRETAALREQLLGKSTAAIERLLVDQIIACWLQLKQAELAAGSDQLTSLMQRRFFDQRLERAQRRYFGAMKLLAQVRRIPLSALIPAKLPDALDERSPLMHRSESGTRLRILPESVERAGAPERRLIGSG